jgi:hypothetical protein
LAVLWGGGVGELVQDHDAAEGGPVEALLVGLDVLVQDGEQAPVQLAHVLVRQVQHEAGEGPDRAWSGFAELGLEGLDRGQGAFVAAVVVGLAVVGIAAAGQPPGLPGGAVGLLQAPLVPVRIGAGSSSPA